MRGIFSFFFIRNKQLRNFLLKVKYSHPFVHPSSTNLVASRVPAMNNKKIVLHRNTNRNVSRKTNFRKDTRISWPGLWPLFSVEQAGSCVEETGRGRGCWRTKEKGGGFRLVSLRFNRNPMETCANTQGRLCTCTVYRLAHVAHYFQSRSQIWTTHLLGSM